MQRLCDLIAACGTNRRFDSHTDAHEIAYAFSVSEFGALWREYKDMVAAVHAPEKVQSELDKFVAFMGGHCTYESTCRCCIRLMCDTFNPSPPTFDPLREAATLRLSKLELQSGCSVPFHVLIAAAEQKYNLAKTLREQDAAAALRNMAARLSVHSDAFQQSEEEKK